MAIVPLHSFKPTLWHTIWINAAIVKWENTKKFQLELPIWNYSVLYAMRISMSNRRGCVSSFLITEENRFNKVFYFILFYLLG